MPAKKPVARKPSPRKPAAREAPVVKPRRRATPGRPAARKVTKPVKRKPAKRKPTAKKTPVTGDLHSLGARVISIFGIFGSRTLIELPTSVAEQLFPEPLILSGRTDVITGAERDVAAIKRRDKALGESGLARAAVALAYEIAHPYNSATSKSMCTRELRETINRLRELAPEEEGTDQLDALSASRADRIAGT